MEPAKHVLAHTYQIPQEEIVSNLHLSMYHLLLSMWHLHLSMRHLSMWHLHLYQAIMYLPTNVAKRTVIADKKDHMMVIHV